MHNLDGAPPGMAHRIIESLGHIPTDGQRRAAEALHRLLGSVRDRPTMVLTGYAGTGKTTLVGALVRTLRMERHPVVLLAPTGRAAKVLAAHARASAGTIHRRIYRMGSLEDGFGGLSLSSHAEEGTLFVVDEASMIGRGGGEGSFGDRDLLADLASHVFSAPRCKLLLIGDPAQLPPVGVPHSPALDVKELSALGLTAGQVRLTEVVRQEEASGILLNATALRELLDSMPMEAPRPGGPSAHALSPDEGGSPPDSRPLPHFTAHDDVRRIDGYDLEDALDSAYGSEGADEVCVICRSNKRAYQYSMQVRARIHDFHEELCTGDRLMVVKNNYYWAALHGRPELIANGEPLEVRRVIRLEERHGLRFADITAGWWNGQEERELEVKVMLDTLAVEAPAMPLPRMRQLAEQVLRGQVMRGDGASRRLLRTDPYMQALQVKYAYAVTCHKAQGGQWRTVFVDQGYVTEEMIDREYVRWLYTAVTRATHRLYLLNFHGRFWGDEE